MNRMHPKALLQRMTMQMLALMVILSPLLTSSMVLAGAPQPNLTRSPSPLLGYGLMFVMTVVVVAISFIPSKRSHLD